MATINNQATLRTAIADWLNRTDLTNTQIDQFIEMGEAMVYETLRVPTLESIESFSISNSSITIPSGYLELRELRKLGDGTCSVSPTTNITRALCVAASGIWTDTDKDDDIVLRRVGVTAFFNSKPNYAFIREGNNFLLTDKEGSQSATGEYILKYYKSDDPIGSTTSTATTSGSFVVDKYYTIVTVGTTDFTTIGASANTVGVVFKATGVGTGTGTATVESTPYILSEYELSLYSALAFGSSFLGDAEAEARYIALVNDKINRLNSKASGAELKGGLYSAGFSEVLI